MSPLPRSATETSADTILPIGYGSQFRTSRNYESWNALIDDTLIEWGRDPGIFSEEGLLAPSRENISRAIAVAYAMRDQGSLPPDSIVPDASGGIIFERRSAERTGKVALYFWGDGSMELQFFHESQLVHREPIIAAFADAAS